MRPPQVIADGIFDALIAPVTRSRIRVRREPTALWRRRRHGKRRLLQFKFTPDSLALIRKYGLFYACADD